MKLFSFLVEIANENPDLSVVIGLGLACFAVALTGIVDALIRGLQ